MVVNQNIQYLSAKGFYNSGKSTAEKLKHLKNDEVYEIIPTAVVCFNFSAELLLKLIFHLRHNKPVKKEHRLNELFNTLPKTIRQDIIENFELKRQLKSEKLFPIKITFNTNPENYEDRKDQNDIENLNFEKFLEIHSDSFVNWRYLFEVKNEYYYYEYNFKLMDDFVNSLFDKINDLVKVAAAKKDVYYK